MAKPEDVVKQEIKSYIDSRHRVYHDWYVGVAENAEERLFEDHGVQRVGDSWIYRKCFTEESARRVEDYFINLGCDGAPGGGNENSVFVYAYKKSPHTEE